MVYQPIDNGLKAEGDNLDHKAQLLARLDAIGESLKNTGDALALLGFGSVGLEMERLDDYSDLDFFAIVKTGYKQAFIDDLGWLSVIHPVVYTFKNTPNGYKLLFEDDIFCEFAVFEPHEFAAIPFAVGRVVWQDASFDASLTAPRSQPIHAEGTLEISLGEALTNLYVGLGRFWRFCRKNGNARIKSDLRLRIRRGGYDYRTPNHFQRATFSGRNHRAVCALVLAL